MQQSINAHPQSTRNPVSEYVSSLTGAEQATIRRMYDQILGIIPEAEQGVSYGMPCLKYKGKAVVSIMVTKKFLSLYPFSAVKKLGLDLSEFETTSGSVHFSVDHPIPDQLLRKIVAGRLRQIAI